MEIEIMTGMAPLLGTPLGTSGTAEVTYLFRRCSDETPCEAEEN